jgi:very-short-patch-repair endonuclease
MKDAESQLAYMLGAMGISFTREFLAIPERRYRFDFRLDGTNILVEVQGGVWMNKAGHNTGAGITRDCEKFSLAVANGYKVMPLTPSQIKTGEALVWIEQALKVMGL